jgi:hypothetical protein
LPTVPQLPEVPLKDLDVKNAWPPGWDVPGPHASRGKDLIYYRHAVGVIAFDRKTNKEMWRLETTRHPFPSRVLEAGVNRAFIQIGSDVPSTLRIALAGGDRNYLMRALEPHTPKQRAAAAALLHRYGDGYLRPQMRKLAERLRAVKDDPAAATAATTVEKLLADWPQTRDRRRLFDGCVAALLNADEGNPLKDFAWPEAPQVFVWCLVQELIYGIPPDAYSGQGFNYSYDGWRERPVSLLDATRMKFADHCRKVVAEGPDATKPFAASVLVSTAVGWATLTDAERKKLFLAPEPSVWRWAAQALARNGRRKELIEWASERAASDHLHVIWVLAHDMPKEWPAAELKFWLAHARKNPADVAWVLRVYGRPVPIDFREPILAYLQGEIKKPTVKQTGTQPAYNLNAALHVLDSWRNADDTPLLLEYLKHPAHNTATRGDGARQTELRVYGLRSHVRALLEQRGAKIPPDVVYEQEIGPAKE